MRSGRLRFGALHAPLVGVGQTAIPATGASVAGVCGGGESGVVVDLTCAGAAGGGAEPVGARAGGVAAGVSAADVDGAGCTSFSVRRGAL